MGDKIKNNQPPYRAFVKPMKDMNNLTEQVIDAAGKKLRESLIKRLDRLSLIKKIEDFSTPSQEETEQSPDR